MQKKRLGPLDIYPLLPRTNCGKCEAKVCMAFAAKLAEGSTVLDECPEIFEERFKSNLQRLREMLKPPVTEVSIGVGDHQVKMGGQLVVHRHEYRYLNPLPIAVSIEDGMKDEEIQKKAREIMGFNYSYIGKRLNLNMIVVRSTSGDPAKFESAVSRVSGVCEWPLILWSFDPKVMERGLAVAHGKRPLLYAATKENWREMAELALKYGCPLTVYSPNDLGMLRSLANTLLAFGLRNIALDPGCEFGAGVKEAIDNLTRLRNAAILGGDDLLGFPIVGSPIHVWDEDGKEPEVKMWEEACLASMMILRYADLLMLRSWDPWVLLPLVVMRENIYTDPRKPVSVGPGLRTISIDGKEPDENSPLMVTSNWALTYFAVKADIEASKVPSYLLLVDTEGTGVQSAIPGRKFTSQKIADAIMGSGIEQRLKHRKVIVPGMAARFKGELEELMKMNWEIMIGPKDSSGIPKFLADNWPKS